MDCGAHRGQFYCARASGRSISSGKYGLSVIDEYLQPDGSWAEIAAYFDSPEEIARTQTETRQAEARA